MLFFKSVSIINFKFQLCLQDELIDGIDANQRPELGKIILYVGWKY